MWYVQIYVLLKSTFLNTVGIGWLKLSAQETYNRCLTLRLIVSFCLHQSHYAICQPLTFKTNSEQYSQTHQSCLSDKYKYVHLQSLRHASLLYSFDSQSFHPFFILYIVNISTILLFLRLLLQLCLKILPLNHKSGLQLMINKTV